MMRHVFAVAFVLSVTIAASGAERFNFTIDQATSSVSSSTSVSVFIPSSLIGNWDAETNPEGTITRNGLFGGSGNQVVDLDLTPLLEGDINSVPDGAFSMTIDTEALTLGMSGLTLDLLGDSPGTVDLTLTLRVPTFRTFQPSSLYIAGTFPVPIGSGQITVFAATQSGDAVGVLVPDEEIENRYGFTVIVPVMMAIEGTFLDQSFGGEPFPSVQTFVGTIDVDGDSATVLIDSNENIDEEVEADPDLGFEDLPFEMPTILPPGEIANVLFSGTPETINTSLDLTLHVEAVGVTGCTRDPEWICDGDVDGDGQVNPVDAGLVQAAFGSVDEQDLCNYDVDCDGQINPVDAGIVQSLFGTCDGPRETCP